LRTAPGLPCTRLLPGQPCHRFRAVLATLHEQRGSAYRKPSRSRCDFILSNAPEPSKKERTTSEAMPRGTLLHTSPTHRFARRASTGGLSPFRQAKAPQSRRVRPRRCVLERRSRPWGEREAPGTKERPSVPKISLNFCLYKGCSPSLQPLELASCEQGVGRNPLAAPSRHPRAPPTGEWASRGALSRTPRTPAPRMLAAAPRDGAWRAAIPVGRCRRGFGRSRRGFGRRVFVACHVCVS